MAEHADETDDSEHETEGARLIDELDEVLRSMRSERVPAGIPGTVGRGRGTGEVGAGGRGLRRPPQELEVEVVGHGRYASGGSRGGEEHWDAELWRRARALGLSASSAHRRRIPGPPPVQRADSHGCKLHFDAYTGAMHDGPPYDIFAEEPEDTCAAKPCRPKHMGPRRRCRGSTFVTAALVLAVALGLAVGSMGCGHAAALQAARNALMHALFGYGMDEPVGWMTPHQRDSGSRHEQWDL